MNTSQHFGPRIIMFICGIACMTFGIALSCKADLGTSPISSVPLVLSMCTPFSVGMHAVQCRHYYNYNELCLYRGAAAAFARFLLARAAGAGNFNRAVWLQHRLVYVGFAGCEPGNAA